MVTVIRNGLEEFKASYNTSKFELYFISFQGVTNSSVLVESVSENCCQVFPAPVMYPGAPLFSVSQLKEEALEPGTTSFLKSLHAEGNPCLVCVYAMAMHAQSLSPLPVSPLSQSPPFPTETPSGPHLGLLFRQKSLTLGSMSALWFKLCFFLGFLVMMLREVGSLLMEFWASFIFLSL